MFRIMFQRNLPHQYLNHNPLVHASSAVRTLTKRAKQLVTTVEDMKRELRLWSIKSKQLQHTTHPQR